MEMTFNKRDEFQRKQIAEKVITLLNSEIDVSPMVIDGNWGTGKTEFCHKLINLMDEAETHHLIYVDAFRADHADEPLLTVLAEVIKVLPSGGAKKNFIKKVLPAVRYSIKALAKAGVGHVLKQDFEGVTDDFDKEFQKIADTAIDVSVESILKAHVEADKNLKALQDALKEIAEAKPIILFVDELDRCRPNFAVSMLEIIKHTFAVEGVQFVLITNTEQLKASINHCYGQTIDAQRYLDKFLKYSFNLPYLQDCNTSKESNVSIKHYKNLVCLSEVLKPFNLQDDPSIRIVEHIIKTHTLSLREIETFVRHLEIYSTLTPQGYLNKDSIFGYKMLTFLSIFIFSIKPALANSIINKRLDAKDIGEFLNKNQLSESIGNAKLDEIELLCYMVCSNCYSNSQIFIPSEDEKSRWKALERSYFNGDYHKPENSIVTICEEAIKALTLH